MVEVIKEKWLIHGDVISPMLSKVACQAIIVQGSNYK
jgi:hypothetical protein